MTRLSLPIPLSLLLACALAISACGTVQVEAPPGGRVRIMDLDEPAKVIDERVVWYALWGGKPLSDDSTADTIARLELREVRVSTKLTAIDSVVNVFAGVFTFARRTVVVEGNR